MLRRASEWLLVCLSVLLMKTCRWAAARVRSSSEGGHEYKWTRWRTGSLLSFSAADEDL